MMRPFAINGSPTLTDQRSILRVVGYCRKTAARQNRDDANVCDARGSNPDGPEVHSKVTLCDHFDHPEFSEYVTIDGGWGSADACSAGFSWMEYVVEIG